MKSGRMPGEPQGEERMIYVGVHTDIICTRSAGELVLCKAMRGMVRPKMLIS